MATTLRELLVEVGFKTDAAALSAVEGAIEGVKGQLKTMAIAVGGAATALFALVETTADYGDTVAKTSQKTGIATGTLQEYQYAARQADVETESFNQGLKFLNKNVDEASRNSGASVEAFARLGVQVKDASGAIKPTDQIFAELADRFEGMPDGPRKTAAAIEIFGRAGQDMIPLLNQGSKGLAAMSAEARRLGIVMDENAIAQSSRFNDEVKRLQDVVLSLKRDIGVALMPTLLEMAEAVRGWVMANREVLKQRLRVVFKAVADVLTILGRGFAAIFKVVNKLVGGFDDLERVTSRLRVGLLAVGAASTILAFQRMANALGIVGKGFRFSAAQAGKFLLKFIAIPLIIAAVAEELFFFMHPEKGVQTALGLFFEEGSESGKAFQKLFGGITDAFKGLAGAVSSAFNVATIESFTAALSSLLEVLKALMPIINSAFFVFAKGIAFTLRGLTDIVNLLRRFGATDAEKSIIDKTFLENAFKTLQDFKDIQKFIGQQFGAAPARPAAGGSTTSAFIAPKVNVEVNVETGASPEAIAAAAQTAFADEMRAVMDRSVRPGLAVLEGSA